MIVRVITLLRKLVERCNRRGRGITRAGREYLSCARAGSSSHVLRSGGLRTPSQYQYPSQKMGVNIPYKAHALKAGFIHQCELSPKVEEYYPQGPPFRYRFRGPKGKLIWTSTIPDFVVVEVDRVVLVETKTE